MDLAVSEVVGDVTSGVSRQKGRGGGGGSSNQVVLTERVYEHSYLRGILDAMLTKKQQAGATRCRPNAAILCASFWHDSAVCVFAAPAVSEAS